MAHTGIKQTLRKMPGLVGLWRALWRASLTARRVYEKFDAWRLRTKHDILHVWRDIARTQPTFELVLYEIYSQTLAAPEIFFNSVRKETAKVTHFSLEQKLQLIKAANLLVNRHEYLSHRIHKAGRPSGFMLDTANACQLGCPTCQHTSNREWAGRMFVPMPSGIMKPDVFADFMRRVGLWSYAGHFYNNSEPFLNKNTPAYLRVANLYRVRTMVSSNLSIPKLDAEAIVASGLDLLMVAIDGATQGVYEKYRRGGKLDLVLENVRAIVAAKKRLKSATPYLRWQFLTFEHNVPEIGDAIRLAMELGMDSFNIATPYDVSGDEPSIKVVIHPLAGRNIVFNAPRNEPWRQELEPIADEIERGFEQIMQVRFEPETPPRPMFGHCDWPHLAIVSDALGRIHPCCLPDYEGQGSFVMGGIRDCDNPFNTPRYLDTRRLFADTLATANNLKDRSRSKCEGCTARATPQVGLGAIQAYLETERLFPESLVSVLTNWSLHQEEFRIPEEIASKRTPVRIPIAVQ